MTLALILLAYVIAMYVNWLILEDERWMDQWSKCIGSVQITTDNARDFMPGDIVEVNGHPLQVYNVRGTVITVGNRRP